MMHYFLHGCGEGLVLTNDAIGACLDEVAAYIAAADRALTPHNTYERSEDPFSSGAYVLSDNDVVELRDGFMPGDEYVAAASALHAALSGAIRDLVIIGRKYGYDPEEFGAWKTSAANAPATFSRRIINVMNTLHKRFGSGWGDDGEFELINAAVRRT